MHLLFLLHFDGLRYCSEGGASALYVLQAVVDVFIGKAHSLLSPSADFALIASTRVF